jgi:hypothetical protein
MMHGMLLTQSKKLSINFGKPKLRERKLPPLKHTSKNLETAFKNTTDQSEMPNSRFKNRHLSLVTPPKLLMNVKWQKTP